METYQKVQQLDMWINITLTKIKNKKTVPQKIHIKCTTC